MASLSFGLLGAENNEEIVKLWLEDGSRLVNEVDYIEDYYAPHTERTEFLMLHKTGEDMTEKQWLNDHYDQIKYINANTKLVKDELEYDIYTLCKKDWLDGYPRPCNFWSPIMCFKEGGRDVTYDIDYVRME
eukprot:UN33988